MNMKVSTLLFCLFLVFGVSQGQFFTNPVIAHSSSVAGASTSVTVSFTYTLQSGLGAGDNFYITLPSYASAWDITGWTPSCTAPSGCNGCAFWSTGTDLTGPAPKFLLTLAMNYCYGNFQFTIANIKNPSVAGAPTAQGEVGAFNAPGKLNGVTLTSSPSTTSGTPSPCGTMVIGTGTGLRGDYYTGMNFNTALGVRRDATVNFDWTAAGPGISGVPQAVYSVRWSGTLTAKFTGVHTFYTNSDDGVRMSINGAFVINNWNDHSPTENTGTYSLVAGQTYNLILEFYQNTGGSTISLSWSSSCLAKEIIPATQLTPKPLVLC